MKRMLRSGITTLGIGLLAFGAVAAQETLPDATGYDIRVYAYPGARDTQFYKSNESGQIVGVVRMAEDAPLQGMIYENRTGELFSVEDANETRPIDINNDGLIVGYYTDSDEVTHAFTTQYGEAGIDALEITTVDHPDATYTAFMGVTEDGTILGEYTDADEVNHVFLYADGEFEVIEIPDALNVFAGGINNDGVIAGALESEPGVYAGYLRDPDGTVTLQTLEDAEEVFFDDVSADGTAVAFFYLNSGDSGTLIRSSDGDLSRLNMENATRVVAWGIRDDGAITGYYVSDDERRRAFIAELE